MNIQVNDFRWEPGKNDAEYIKLLESSRDEWQRLTQKAISKLEALSKAQEPRVLTLEEVLNEKYGLAGWLEWSDYTIYPAVLRARMDECAIDYVAFNHAFLFFPKDYGTDVRCWSARPTDEERKAVKWDD